MRHTAESRSVPDLLVELIDTVKSVESLDGMRDVFVEGLARVADVYEWEWETFHGETGA